MKKGIQKLKQAEIIIALPSYNEADNISFVTKIVDQGLRRYYPDFKSLIINLDSSSLDKTRGIFLKTKTRLPKISLISRRRGKGNNFLNLFQKISARLPGQGGGFRPWSGKNLKRLKAVAVVDTDLKSIEPIWIKKLINPILKSYDYVTPLYRRYKYDATITNHIVYPVIYGLLGTNLRQPIGGEFAFKPELVNLWLKKKWNQAIKNYGIDIFMTSQAILGNFKICQTELGLKIHKASLPKLDLMFSQVTKVLFDNLLSQKNFWFKDSKIQTIPHYNLKTKRRKLKGFFINPSDLRKNFLEKFEMAKKDIQQILSKRIYQELIKNISHAWPKIDPDLWSKIVYDFIFAYDLANRRRKKIIIEALKPLYFGRLISFFRATINLDGHQTEIKILSQAKRFFNNRDYLLSKWNKK